MVRIAPVNLNYNPKTLWFDARDLELAKGAAVVVLTARGVEFGHVASEVFEATPEQVKKLKSSLKPVKRLATPEDEEKARKMEDLSRDALPIFKEMAAEAGADMRPVSVEYLLDGDKAVFYFEAEERVDFRELVRKLAARFHVRIDMRQIGVRDEARMVGGLGHCGQELCCKRMGGEFCPVSIRMAKEQDLSLNPQKISGVCGRLMCCLRYEYDAYKEFKSRAPKQNATIQTPDGPAKVTDLDVPREVISVRLDGEKPVKVPLSCFEPPAEGSNRPNAIGQEAWDAANSQGALGVMGEGTFLTSQFTESDKLADPSTVRRTPGGSGRSSRQQREGGRKGEGAQKGASSEQRKPRRRRSTKVAADGSTIETKGGEGRSQKQRSEKQQGQGQGQQRKKQGGKKQGQAANGSGSPKKQGQQGQQKRGQQGQQKQQQKQGGAQPPKGSVRPGQKSSGLRQRKPQQDGAPEGSPQRTRSGDQGKQDANGQGGQAHRRSRRRSHRSGASEQGAGKGPADQSGN